MSTSQKNLDAAVINGTLDGSERAGADAADLVQSTFEKIAPAGLHAVTLTETGNAVEQAIFSAMRKRGADPRFTAMGFTGSNHGNSLVLAQFSHPGKSLDLGWPSMTYPENVGQEAQILDKIRGSLQTHRNAGQPVAAIVIEPTNQLTGYVASAGFLNELTSLAREAEAALIIDEAGSGCGASGEGFWQFTGKADYVTFGKRTQVSGFFSKEEDGTATYSLSGSRLALLQFATIAKQVEQRKLVEQVKTVGQSMMTQAIRSTEKSGKFAGVRGVGSQLWIDTKSADDAQRLYKHMREHGVLVKLNGTRGVMAKPALTLKEDQVGPLTQGLGKF